MFRRHVLARARLITRRIRWFAYHSLLHADDPPERLARGVAIGVFIGFTPAIGLQMVLVIALAWAMRANKVAGIPFVWLTNPVTIVPIYYPCYVLGALIMQREVIGLDWWMDLRHPPSGWWESVRFYWERMMEIGLPLWVGCGMVGLLAGLLAYFITFHSIRTYRHRKWGRLMPPDKVLAEDPEPPATDAAP